MADLLLCGAKTFSHVQIFAPDQNKRKGTIPLCTMEVRDCGTPQHLKCKSNLIWQNKTDIIRLDSCTTRVLAKGWHREISKCWGVLHWISQVTDLLPFVCSFFQMDVGIYSTSQKEINILHGNLKVQRHQIEGEEYLLFHQKIYTICSLSINSFSLLLKTVMQFITSIFGCHHVL